MIVLSLIALKNLKYLQGLDMGRIVMSLNSNKMIADVEAPGNNLNYKKMLQISLVRRKKG